MSHCRAVRARLRRKRQGKRLPSRREPTLVDAFVDLFEGVDALENQLRQAGERLYTGEGPLIGISVWSDRS